MLRGPALSRGALHGNWPAVTWRDELPLLFSRAVALGLLSSLMTALAHADEGHSSPTAQSWGAWSAPADCIGAAVLLAQVKASFGPVGPATDRRVEGDMLRESGGFTVRFRVFQSERWLAERRLSTRQSCRRSRCLKKSRKIPWWFSNLRLSAPPASLSPPDQPWTWD